MTRRTSVPSGTAPGRQRWQRRRDDVLWYSSQDRPLSVTHPASSARSTNDSSVAIAKKELARECGGSPTRSPITRSRSAELVACARRSTTTGVFELRVSSTQPIAVVAASSSRLEQGVLAPRTAA